MSDDPKNPTGPKSPPGRGERVAAGSLMPEQRPAPAKRVIWKFPIDTSSQPRMPKGAKILHTGLDPAQRLCVWALCDPESPLVTKNFAVLPTGLEFNAAAVHYVGTVRNGLFVWHVFDLGES